MKAQIPIELFALALLSSFSLAGHSAASPPDPSPMELVPDSAFIDLTKPFSTDAQIVAENQQGSDGKTRYVLRKDGSALFSSADSAHEPWKVKCGVFNGERACRATSFNLEVDFMKTAGWAVIVSNEQPSKCHASFILLGGMSFQLQGEAPEATTRFVDREGRVEIGLLSGMDGFTAPCSPNPEDIKRTVKFGVIKRYMEWAVAGQPTEPLPSP